MIVFFQYQLNAQILYFNTFTVFLYMFRALLCSSSGGQIVLVQHLVSSLWKQVSGLKLLFSYTDVGWCQMFNATHFVEPDGCIIFIQFCFDDLVKICLFCSKKFYHISLYYDARSKKIYKKRRYTGLQNVLTVTNQWFIAKGFMKYVTDSI